MCNGYLLACLFEIRKINLSINNVIMMEFDQIDSGNITVIEESDFEIVGCDIDSGSEFMAGVEEMSSIIDEQVVCFDMDCDVDPDIDMV